LERGAQGAEGGVYFRRNGQPSSGTISWRYGVTSARFAPWALLGARVFMGAFFLYEASNQLAKGWIGGDGLRNMIASALRDNSIPGPYRSFLENVVIEHDKLFTLLVIPGEIAVGLALVLGIVTRLSALVALSMNINFAIMNGVVTAGGLFDMLFVVLEVVLLAFAARQALSVDGMLARRGVVVPQLTGIPRERDSVLTA
jgi:thiosulfate dehydrogenase [quinone] large subunit